MQNSICLVFLIALVCSGCATAVPLMKIKEEIDRYGYTVADHGLPNAYVISTSLPKGMLEDEYRWYVNVAAGRTCKHLGFDYFDTSLRAFVHESRNLIHEQTDVYCLKTQKLRGLSIKFERADKNPYNGVVEVSDFQKDRSFLQIGDYILMVNNSLVSRYNDIMRAVYTVIYTKPKATSIPIDIIRDGKQMHFDEPITNTVYDAYGPDDLKKFEAWVGAQK